MEIQNKKIDMESHYLDKVTYIPGHAKGNAGHKDCEHGVILGISEIDVRVLYSRSRTVQSTRPQDLVWG